MAGGITSAFKVLWSAMLPAWALLCTVHNLLRLYQRRGATVAVA